MAQRSNSPNSQIGFTITQGKKASLDHRFNNLPIQIKASLAAVLLMLCLLTVGTNAYLTSARSADALRTLSDDLISKQLAFTEIGSDVVVIHDYISALPDGYNAPVGEGGKWLSEGQKQRISLARAILPSPDLLLLDEVTSSLDPENEVAINATIRALAKEKTVMMVTHRLASATFADQIFVMDQGRIREHGSHEDLLKLGGLYHHLWQMQTGFTVRDDGNYAEVSGDRPLAHCTAFLGTKWRLSGTLRPLFVRELCSFKSIFCCTASPDSTF